MSAPTLGPPPALPAAVRGGTVAVLLAGEVSDDQVIAVAASIANEHQARISILSIPRRLPLGVYFTGWVVTPAFSILTLRAEAIADAAVAGRQAACRLPGSIPVEHLVVEGSPSAALEELIGRQAIVQLVIDRTLLRGRPRLRRASNRWRSGQVPLVVV